MAYLTRTNQTNLRDAQAAALKFQLLCRRSLGSLETGTSGLNRPRRTVTHVKLSQERSVSSRASNRSPSKGPSGTSRLPPAPSKILFSPQASASPSTPAKAPIVPKASTSVDISQIKIVILRHSHLKLPPPLYQQHEGEFDSYSALYYKFAPTPPWYQTSNSSFAKLLRELRDFGSKRTADQLFQAIQSMQAEVKSSFGPRRETKPHIVLPNNFPFPKTIAKYVVGAILLVWCAEICIEFIYSNPFMQRRERERRQRAERLAQSQNRSKGQNQTGNSGEVVESEEAIDGNAREATPTGSSNTVQLLSEIIKPTSQVESLVEVLDPTTGDTSSVPATPGKQDVSQTADSLDSDHVSMKDVTPLTEETPSGDKDGEGGPRTDSGSWKKWFKLW